MSIYLYLKIHNIKNVNIEEIHDCKFHKDKK